MRQELSNLLGHVMVVQLQGNIFFANATALAEELESILQADNLRRHEIKNGKREWGEEGRGGGGGGGGGGLEDEDEDEEGKEERKVAEKGLEGGERRRRCTWKEIKIILLDFTLVLGIDSSAAGRVIMIIISLLPLYLFD